jgi:hypothetical protein
MECNIKLKFVDLKIQQNNNSVKDDYLSNKILIYHVFPRYMDWLIEFYNFET